MKLPVMAVRIFSLRIVTAGVLSGCTTKYFARDLLCDEKSGSSPASRAAGCMTAAAYEMAQKKGEEHQDQAKTGKDTDKGEGKKADPRYEEWIP